MSVHLKKKAGNMPKIFIILLLALITTNCKGIADMKTSSWKIIQSTSKNQFFKEGLIVDFSGSNIRFQEGVNINSYPVIVTDTRMVIETGYIKWLFEIEISDSMIILHELYSKEPVIISLTKINNLKNNKS
jgi:hypothetical protein